MRKSELTPFLHAIVIFMVSFDFSSHQIWPNRMQIFKHIDILIWFCHLSERHPFLIAWINENVAEIQLIQFIGSFHKKAINDIAATATASASAAI